MRGWLKSWGRKLESSSPPHWWNPGHTGSINVCSIDPNSFWTQDDHSRLCQFLASEILIMASLEQWRNVTSTHYFWAQRRTQWLLPYKVLYILYGVNTQRFIQVKCGPASFNNHALVYALYTWIEAIITTRFGQYAVVQVAIGEGDQISASSNISGNRPVAGLPWVAAAPIW